MPQTTSASSEASLSFDVLGQLLGTEKRPVFDILSSCLLFGNISPHDAALQIDRLSYPPPIAPLLHLGHETPSIQGRRADEWEEDDDNEGREVGCRTRLQSFYLNTCELMLDVSTQIPPRHQAQSKLVAIIRELVSFEPQRVFVMDAVGSSTPSTSSTRLTASAAPVFRVEGLSPAVHRAGAPRPKL